MMSKEDLVKWITTKNYMSILYEYHKDMSPKVIDFMEFAKKIKYYESLVASDPSTPFGVPVIDMVSFIKRVIVHYQKELGVSTLLDKDSKFIKFVYEQ
jgi:hypothetical protein